MISTFAKFILAIFLLPPFFTFSQTNTSRSIKVHFWYGSRPFHKTKAIESKYFGGIHGGHVTIEVDSIDYGFNPGYPFHYVARKKKRSSSFVSRPTGGQAPYSKGDKYVTFIIPISEDQHSKINQIHANYCKDTPYDYAFLGMRCASATQDILGQIGVVKPRRHFHNVLTTFYPKKLRKRLFKLSAQKNYQIIKQEGRSTRKWEKD